MTALPLFEDAAQREWFRCRRLYRNAPWGHRRRALRRLQCATMALLIEELR